MEKLWKQGLEYHTGIGEKQSYEKAVECYKLFLSKYDIYPHRLRDIILRLCSVFMTYEEMIELTPKEIVVQHLAELSRNTREATVLLGNTYCYCYHHHKDVIKAIVLYNKALYGNFGADRKKTEYKLRKLFKENPNIFEGFEEKKELKNENKKLKQKKKELKNEIKELKLQIEKLKYKLEHRDIKKLKSISRVVKLRKTT